MIQPSLIEKTHGPAYRYHLLRAASERFQTDPGGLDRARLDEAARQAARSLELEELVLASREAQAVVIPPEQVAAGVAEVRGRYRDRGTFEDDLARNGLDAKGLALALRRELAFDAVMQRVASKAADVDEIDQRLYYEMHRERFTTPERRTARHILITINDDFSENRREAARSRIERLAEKLAGRPAGAVARFAALARKHSECPTAMQDGRLGEVPRGQLYPELDALLFALPEGQVGGPVESEIGFHLVFCERIARARAQPFSKVRDAIDAHLLARRQRNCQKAWIAELREAAAGSVSEPMETAAASPIAVGGLS
ncbi:MAG: nitrogen fixation protein NifM [Gammaproteobacteria bacterium]|nr:nitrogen fixation protein NifM [Gammaproteobacteria bacterium]